MKTFFRVLVLGIFMVALTAGTSTVTYAQADEKTTIYTQYTDNYAGTIEQRKIAVAAAKKYIQKYGNSADDKQIVDYLKAAIPALEKGIADEIEAARLAKIEAAKQARYAKFDKNVRASDWEATYRAGDEILAAEPNQLDVLLVMASVGFDEIYKTPPVDKYNNATIKYSKMALAKMKSGVTSKNYGAFKKYTYGKKDSAMAWMNYQIGMLMYHRQGKMDPMKKKASLSYLFDSTKGVSDRAKEPRTYGMIGDWYFDTATKLVAKRNIVLNESKELLKKRNSTKDKDEAAELDKQIDEREAKVDASVALEKAYADRALDAYARAYQLAKANPKEPQAYKDVLLKTINDLYNFRYQKPEEKTPARVNMFIAGVMTKPMPHPATPVKPVVTKPATPVADEASQ